MARPAGGYKLKDGTKVYGVTTIIEQWGLNKRALNWYWWDQGRQGAEWMKPLEKEAALGTLIHSWIEAELRGTPRPEIPAEHKERAENAMLGFWEWRDAMQLEVTGSELPLVSETYHYGGTIDYPVRLKGRRAILDLKSSKEVYIDHRVQLAAYRQLWNENFPDDPAVGHHLLRVGKADGSFAHHFWPSLMNEWESFTHLLALHELARQMK